ncbi:MAG: hypothetical protein IPG69_20975 [Flavobacteriales bacterium]|nr:hypothetical protein [Flavobacteriales bacterium]
MKALPMLRAKVALLLLGVAMVLGACLKTDEFPEEPIIRFKEFTTTGDSAALTIFFTDGDGDIGLGQGDTLPPYDTMPYVFNLFVEYEELQNGVWVPFTGFTFPFLHQRVPVITPTGQNKTLEGEITYRFTDWPTIPNTPWDTVRYTVKLVDRALHESNIVRTVEIILPQ